MPLHVLFFLSLGVFEKLLSVLQNAPPPLPWLSSRRLPSQGSMNIFPSIALSQFRPVHDGPVSPVPGVLEPSAGGDCHLLSEVLERGQAPARSSLGARVWNKSGPAWARRSLCNLSKHLATGPGRKLTSRVPLGWQPCSIYKYILNADQPTCIPVPRPPEVPSQRKKGSRRPSRLATGGPSR